MKKCELEDCPMNKPCEDPEGFQMPEICKVHVEKYIKIAINSKDITPDYYKDVVVRVEESNRNSREALEISKRNSGEIREIREKQSEIHDSTARIQTTLDLKLPAYEKLFTDMSDKISSLTEYIMKCLKDEAKEARAMAKEKKPFKQIVLEAFSHFSFAEKALIVGAFVVLGLPTIIMYGEKLIALIQNLWK